VFGKCFFEPPRPRNQTSIFPDQGVVSALEVSVLASQVQDIQRCNFKGFHEALSLALAFHMRPEHCRQATWIRFHAQVVGDVLKHVAVHP